MHDLNGTPLKVGDKITIEYVIESTSAGPDYCNITAKSTHGRRPDGMKETFCGNSGVCVLQRTDDFAPRRQDAWLDNRVPPERRITV